MGASCDSIAMLRRLLSKINERSPLNSPMEKDSGEKAIVSNASVWDTLKLLPQKTLPQKFRTQRERIPDCDSFMHLHLGIDASGIASDLPCHHLVVNDWDSGITSPQNVVAVSIPSFTGFIVGTTRQAYDSCLHTGDRTL